MPAAHNVEPLLVPNIARARRDQGVLAGVERDRSRPTRCHDTAVDREPRVGGLEHYVEAADVRTCALQDLRDLHAHLGREGAALVRQRRRQQSLGTHVVAQLVADHAQGAQRAGRGAMAVRLLEQRARFLPVAELELLDAALDQLLVLSIGEA